MDIKNAVIFLLFIYGCDPVGSKLVLINERNNAIAYYVSDSDQAKALRYFSKISSKRSDGVIAKKEFRFVAAKGRDHVETLGNWEDFLDRRYHNGPACVFVIDSINIGRDTTTLRVSNMVTRRYLYLNDMEISDWKLIIK